MPRRRITQFAHSPLHSALCRFRGADSEGSCVTLARASWRRGQGVGARTEAWACACGLEPHAEGYKGTGEGMAPAGHSAKPLIPSPSPRPSPHTSLTTCQPAPLNNFSVNAVVLGARGT